VKLYPGRRLASGVALCAIACAVAAFLDHGWWPVALLLPLAAVSVADGFALARLPPAAVIRAPYLLAWLRRPLVLRMEVVGAGVVGVAPSWPRELGEPLEELTADGCGRHLHLSWRRLPCRRGSFALEPVWVWRRSRVGLWLRRESVAAPCLIDVFAARPSPPAAAPRQAYGPAAGACGRSVMAVVDAGRLMRGACGGFSKFDACLASVERLANEAGRHRDPIGALIYAHRPLRLVPPKHVYAQPQRLLCELAEVAPGPQESDLATALPLLLRLPARSLVVVLTDLEDDGGAAALLNVLQQLARQHAVAVQLFRDPALDEALERRILRRDDAYRRAAAELLLADRARGIERLRAYGVRLVDLPSTREGRRGWRQPEQGLP
jgi:uncharacterized protein (DUF58 family)